ncbi:MAG TPA: SUMF1/EgtB/PvdO family nonheme iron enzyme, partial [Ktedonobacterales bacterium]
LSPGAMSSQWVNDEVNIAWSLKHTHPNRLIIPVLWRATPGRPDLRTLNWVKFAEPNSYEAALAELVAHLREHAQQMGAPSASPDELYQPPSGGAEDPAAMLARQLVPEIEEAAQRQDWQVVADKTAYLSRYAPAAVSPPIYRLCGRALLELGQLKLAREALDAALALDPTDVPTLLAAARVRRGLGQEAEAAPLLRDALALVGERAERLALLREYAAVLAGLKEWDEVLWRTEEALRLAPDDPAWLQLRLAALAALNRQPEALEVARQLTARPEATAEQWLERARLARAVTNDEAEVRLAIAAAERLAGAATPEIARVRRELLPPPIAAERFPIWLEDLGFAAQKLGDVEVITPPVVPVPAGDFLMGGDKQRDPQTYDDEVPPHPLTLPAFQIAKFPVTVAEYACFVRTGQRQPQEWPDQATKLGHPVVYITWHDAVAYAAWLAKLTGQPWRLPTEAEWEKTARWDAERHVSRIYPWGDVWETSRANTSASGNHATTPVGHYPSGASPSGAQDLAGNVWEWTSSLLYPYPYQQQDGREDPSSAANRVLRGGSWADPPRNARAACRNRDVPGSFSAYRGFRLLLATPGA